MVSEYLGTIINLLYDTMSDEERTQKLEEFLEEQRRL